MKTEADIAAYLGTEGCIVYSQAFSTISSVIPAFCKRGDIIVADKAVNYAIRKGLELSRSNIKWFEHGNMEDLEVQMKKVADEQAKQKKLTRRFIVTEGLFEMTGDCTDLPRLVIMNPVAVHCSNVTADDDCCCYRLSSRRSTSSASSLTRRTLSVCLGAPGVASQKPRTWTRPRSI